MQKASRILVTGAAGFIGSHIARRLLSQGYKVTVADNLATGKKGNVPDGADFIKMDLGRIDDYGRLHGLDCEAVFHLAGQSSGEDSFKDPLYDFNSHAMSTFLLLDWCKRTNVRRFMYSSSMAVYGDPVYLPVDEKHPLQPKTFYAAAKLAAEAYIRFYQTFGIDVTILRFFSVYGPGQDLGNKNQGMVSIYLSYILEGKPIIVKGSGERFRDLVYIDDVVNAWMLAFDNKVSFGKTYNVANGKKTRVMDLINALRSATGNEDYSIDYREGTPGDQFGMLGSNDLIRLELGWAPRFDLSAGLETMIGYYRGVQATIRRNTNGK
jgi:UDP-glucose 4-epimerase